MADAPTKLSAYRVRIKDSFGLHDGEVVLALDFLSAAQQAESYYRRWAESSLQLRIVGMECLGEVIEMANAQNC